MRYSVIYHLHLFLFYGCLESMGWEEIVRNPLTNMHVIRIHFCQWELDATVFALSSLNRDA